MSTYHHPNTEQSESVEIPDANTTASNVASLQTRRRPRWQQQGEDPDYRFSLANERTFLAWIRTALALLAAGVFLDQMATSYRPVVGQILSMALVIVAAMFATAAYFRWRANEIAMRNRLGLPYSRIFYIAALLLVGISIATGILIFD